ncbi:MAG: transposase [Phycisphaerales bacterium]
MLHRKTMRRRETDGGARFLTFSCDHRQPLLAREGVRDLFSACLKAARERHGFDLFAWVVMPEHVHLLIRPIPETTVETILRSLKIAVARRVLSMAPTLLPFQPEIAPTADGSCTAAGRRPRFWQPGGGFDRNVRDEFEFFRTVHYIHHNPVERGLATRPEDYPWSSVRWWTAVREGSTHDRPDSCVECDPFPGKGWWRTGPS